MENLNQFDCKEQSSSLSFTIKFVSTYNANKRITHKMSDLPSGYTAFDSEEFRNSAKSDSGSLYGDLPVGFDSLPQGKQEMKKVCGGPKFY